MKVLSKRGDKAIVKSSGINREISVALLKDVKIGDYVIVHAGFAIEKVNEARAKETLEIWKEMQP